MTENNQVQVLSQEDQDKINEQIKLILMRYALKCQIESKKDARKSKK